ncbi:MAG: alpha/beta hydrolase [Ruminococcus flavefaciens]|nr:alpha/beta hydrolase [Ruminococcus flavefaciens]
MAASYAANHAEELDGLVLLAAYSTEDLTQSDLAVCSIYDPEDGVLNKEKYDANRGNLPNDTVELVIDGGCHAGCGCYGLQYGDGAPWISA